jgi:hypothetical protein
MRIPPLKDIEVAIRGLPRQFDGYTILQLTDLHISRLFPASLDCKGELTGGDRNAESLIDAAFGTVVTEGTNYGSGEQKIEDRPRPPTCASRSPVLGSRQAANPRDNQ